MASPTGPTGGNPWETDPIRESLDNWGRESLFDAAMHRSEQMFGQSPNGYNELRAEAAMSKATDEQLRHFLESDESVIWDDIANAETDTGYLHYH